MGRPSTYTPEVAGEICARLAEGESLRTICDDEGMPARSTVVLWLSAHQEFSDHYAHARDAGLDFLADECITIADDETGDAQRDRLRFDARRWYLSKLAPKRYGEKVAMTGADGEGPVEHVFRWADES